VGALLLSGEVGVGKTALVRDASSQLAENARLLWAPCLPLTSQAVPFLPLTTALRGWAVGHGVEVPVLQTSDSAAPGHEPAEFDGWLDQVGR
jgi:hypothetical protein